MNVAILISGNGSNLQAICDFVAHNPAYTVKLVISDNIDAFGIVRATNLNIPTVICQRNKYKTKELFEEDISVALKKANCDIIVLAGFMRILSANFIASFAGPILNIHPSLLPKYKGLDTHQRVLAAKDKLHGCSVHIVTADLDSGPIIAQCQFKVSNDDDVKSLTSKTHAAEHWLYPRVIEWIATGKIKWQDNMLSMENNVLSSPALLLEQQNGGWSLANTDPNSKIIYQRLLCHSATANIFSTGG